MMKINNGGGLFGFAKREGFYKLVLYSKPSKLAFPTTDMPLVIYVPYRYGNAPIETEKWLQSQGFKHLIKLERYVLKNYNPLSKEPSNNVAAASADEVYKFLNQYFSWIDMDLPPRDTYNPENSFCHRADNGELQGVVYDMGHTRIVAVSSAARGLGIGGKLYRAYMERAMQDRKTPAFYEWIRPDNSASIAMFRKLGFEKDTLVSDCWVKKTI